jgi:hypothetical protein
VLPEPLTETVNVLGGGLVQFWFPPLEGGGLVQFWFPPLEGGVTPQSPPTIEPRMGSFEIISIIPEGGD